MHAKPRDLTRTGGRDHAQYRRVPKPHARSREPFHTGWLFNLFSRHISRMQWFQQNRHVTFPAHVALNLLVSLISRLVAHSARIVVDKQTDRQTDRQTDTQNDYCNPRCACAPRVNELPRVGLEPTTLYTLDRALYQLSYRGSTAGWAQISHLIVHLMNRLTINSV